MCRGVSLISLIITILVIIILAAVVIVSSMSAPKAANKAVFFQDFGTIQDIANSKRLTNINTAITGGTEIPKDSNVFIPMRVEGSPVQEHLDELINPDTGKPYTDSDGVLAMVGANAYYIDLEELQISSKFGNGKKVARSTTSEYADVRITGDGTYKGNNDIFVMSSEGRVFYLQGFKAEEDDGSTKVYYTTSSLIFGADDLVSEYESVPIKYTEGEIKSTDGKFTCSIASNNVITLNGTTKEKFFIKISNGLEVSNVFKPQWVTSAIVPLIGKGNGLLYEAEIIGGSFTGNQINVVLRNKSNSPNFNCMLENVENRKVQSKGIATSDICVAYLYIDSGVTCDNLKIRTTLKKEKIVGDEIKTLNLSDGSYGYREDYRVKVTDNQIMINKEFSQPTYVKLLDGFEAYETGNNTAIMNTWTQNSRIIAKAGQKVKIELEILGGTKAGSQLNFVLKDRDNNVLANCKVFDGELEKEILLPNDAVVFYMYISGDTQFDTYTLSAKISIVE